MRHLKNSTAALAIMGMLGAAAAGAQGYPAKPIRMIVQFAPGGQGDIIGRALAGKASETFRQTVIIDNRPGAAGTIAAETAIRAQPDGYTLLLVSSGYATNAALYKQSFNPVTDVTPIIQIGATGMLLTVNPSLPATNVKELIAYDKANPGKINYGSSGTGSTPHLAGELFKQMTGTTMAHVPYKGNVLALNDLLGGQIQMIYGNAANTLPQIRANKLRGLAITSTRRATGAPDIPPVSDTVPGYEAVLWYAVLAPRGLPRDIVARWNGELNRILQLPDVKERLIKDGVEIDGGSPDRFREVLERDIARWQRVVKLADIKAGG
jgi:tripartite-type tricarboxylate transporter receptor subunit TctC